MKRLIAFTSTVVFTTVAFTSATAAPKPEHHKAAVCAVAPADEYFGRMKMSVLGIRNVIRDQGARVDADPSNAPGAIGSVAFAEDALHDWEHHYSCDRWIPWTIYALEHFYGKIHTADGVKHVHRVVAWLKHDYPHVGGVLSFAAKDEATAVAAVTPPTAPVAVVPPVIPVPVVTP